MSQTSQLKWAMTAIDSSNTSRSGSNLLASGTAATATAVAKEKKYGW